ncbi:response regulator [Woodsholea maritima]|uniref:response regulator n=1 Tax=Woodsholea maritima TaxID=240237 RepID=UPI00035C8C22|nr:response regulator [Woodsholea maritima]
MASKKVIVLEDDDTLRFVISKALSRAGLEMRATASMTTALELLAKGEGDLLIADVLLGEDNFLDALPDLKRARPELPIIVITAQATAASAIKAQKGGAFEYLPKPFDLDDLVGAVERARTPKKRMKISGSTGKVDALYPHFVGQGPAMQAVYSAIGRLARHRHPVLIEGPQGSGRASAALTLNSARGFDDLLIYGPYEVSQNPGLIKSLQAPVLLRDGQLWDGPTQQAILEGLQARTSAFPIYVTLTPGAERDLLAGLIYQLGLSRLSLPPLHTRLEDMELLIDSLLQRLQLSSTRIDPSAIKALQAYDWPGEVAQLRAVVVQAVLAHDGPITHSDITPLLHHRPQGGNAGSLYDSALTFCFDAIALQQENIRDLALEELDRALITQALDHSRGIRQDAAKLLGLNRNTLARRMEQLNFSHPSGD